MSIENLILKLLSGTHYTPLQKEEIQKKLKLKGSSKSSFEKTFKGLEKTGQIVRLKKDRFCFPKDADLVTGIINFRSNGSAYLKTGNNPNITFPLHIEPNDTNVAFHGDRVVARLINNPRPKFRRGGRRPRKSDDDKQYGRVIRILERSRATITGTLLKSGNFYFVVPDHPKIPRDILVPHPRESNLTEKPKINDKVVIRLEEWTDPYLNPQGEIIKILGVSHTPHAEFDSILHNYNLSPDFPDAVEREVSAIPSSVQPAERQNRLDLRNVFTLTIDPDDAKDFDDALSLEVLPNGNTRIGVHIADVSAYVKPNTNLDREAQKRGNSTYLVGQVIPMLPHKLSNGICSLKEAEDRLVKTTFLTFDKNHKLVDTQFANAIIYSRKRLTYHQAFAFLKEDNLDKIRELPLPPAHQTGSTGRPLVDLTKKELQEIQSTVRKLWEIAALLRSKRMQKGSLDLDMPEVKIFVDPKGYAERIERIEYDESHQLIEEFMLAANEAVAKRLTTDRFPSLYRVHENPEADKLDELRSFADAFGIKVGDLSQRKEMVRLIAKAKDHDQGYQIRIQVLRSLKQAHYAAEPIGHYGLHKKHYTHFTSPIRRYSDLIVHRVFDHYLTKHGNETAPKELSIKYSQGKLDGLGQHLSITEQNSTQAERESVKIKLLEFFERELQNPQATLFDAVITDVKNHGLFVELTESLAFGFIHISSLRDDLYELGSDGRSLIGRKRRRRYTLGQIIQVTVERVDRYKRQIDFKIHVPKKQPRK